MKKKRNFLKKLLNNWALKLFSIAAAFFLWLFVMIMENPEDQKTFYNIPVKLVNTEVLTDMNMVYQILEGTDVVPRVTVTATKTIRDDLSASDIIAEADFSNLTVANTVEIRFYSQRYGDRITEITGSIKILRLDIEERKTKLLTLQVNPTGTVDEGYVINSITQDQNRIEVSGPESVISRIASASVTVNVSDANSNISTYADVGLYDAEGNKISTENLDMNAESVLVKVEILGTKTVPIRYVVSGEPADGYLFSGVIESDPTSIVLAGTAEILNGVREITIPEGLLDITGQTQNLVTSFNIRDYLPEGTVLADRSFNGRVEVIVDIEKAVTRNIRVNAAQIQITGVPDGCSAVLENSAYIVEITGLAEELEALEDILIQGEVDLSELSAEYEPQDPEGDIYEAEVTFSLPESITVTRPVKVQVRIMKSEDA